MSNQEKTDKQRRDMLADCTITELEDLLNAAAQDTPADESYIASLEAAILRLETEHPSGRLSEPDKAWERFRKMLNGRDSGQFDLSGEEKNLKAFISKDSRHQPYRPRRLGRVLLAAAIIIVMVTLLLPTVLGYRDIFHMVAQWTDGQFRFTAQEYGSPETAQENRVTENLTPLMESLEEYSLPLSFAPTWFPEDRHLYDVQYRETDYGKTFFTAVFTDENDERLVYFKLVKSSQDKEGASHSLIWEKDDGEVIEFLCGGIVHYIITNCGSVGAHWYVGQFEAAVFGDISMDETKAIVESIYER